MEIREISENEYSDFIKSFQYSSIYQTVEYASVMKKQNYNYLFLAAYEGNTVVGASLLLIRINKGFQYAYAPRGFYIDYSNKTLLMNFTKELKRFLNSKGIVAIKISPLIIRNILNKEGKVIGTNPNYDMIFNNLKECGYYHFGYNKGFEAYKPRFEAILDISKDYRLLFKNIKKEYKTKIRSAEKQGIRIYRANSNELSYLYDLIKDKYPRKLDYLEDSLKYYGKSDKMDYYYAKLDTKYYIQLIQKEYTSKEEECNRLNSLILGNKENSSLIGRKMDADKQLSIYRNKLVEATELLKNHPEGLVLASVLIAKERDEIQLYMDGYNPHYKSFNAKHILLWKIIEKYSKLGFRRFNLGGIADITNDKYKGLFQFKTNFGANIVEYIGDLELVINTLKYAMYKHK